MLLRNKYLVKIMLLPPLPISKKLSLGPVPDYAITPRLIFVCANIIEKSAVSPDKNSRKCVKVGEMNLM